MTASAALGLLRHPSVHLEAVSRPRPRTTCAAAGGWSAPPVRAPPTVGTAAAPRMPPSSGRSAARPVASGLLTKNPEIGAATPHMPRTWPVETAEATASPSALPVAGANYEYAGEGGATPGAEGPNFVRLGVSKVSTGFCLTGFGRDYLVYCRFHEYIRIYNGTTHTVLYSTSEAVQSSTVQYSTS